MTRPDEPGDRATPARRVALVAVASVLGGMIAAGGVIGSEALEPRLTASARQALRDEGVSGIQVRFDGREAFLSSEGASAAELTRAESIVEAIAGVRWATIVEPPVGTTPAPTPTPTSTGPTPEDIVAIDGTVILFAADSVTIDAAAGAAVHDLAELLRRYPDVEVDITGHVAIPVGTEADAVAFSVRRAQAVADALTADGIAAARLHVAGAGSSQPVADNSTDAGAAANRRATVLIMEGT
ncbi:OmpA family protein [soil metagenome]